LHRRRADAAFPHKGEADGARRLAVGEPAAALTLQFLAFIGGGRSYGETMEAWRSTCPRMSIWEDAVRDGLVRIEGGDVMAASRVVLTQQGQARLGRAQGHCSPC
jgi:hypothetical protein